MSDLAARFKLGLARHISGKGRPGNSHGGLALVSDLSRPPPMGRSHVVGPPHFVGVGAQKAGTSWLYRLLADHPEVYHHPGLPKERHFFDRVWHGGEQNVYEAYSEWFPRPKGTVVGEWTPSYAWLFWIPELLAAAAPQARILVSLRDPVERFQSGVNHVLSYRRDVTSALAEAFDRGRYEQQLRRLKAHFPVEQIFVCQYEAFVADPKESVSMLYRFLGIDDGFLPSALTEYVNQTLPKARYRLSDGMRRSLQAQYEAEVGSLCREEHLDVRHWPNFRHLA